MRQTQENAENGLKAEATEEYEIKVDTVAFADCPLDFEPYLFNRPAHLATQRRKNPISIGLWGTHDRRIAAILHFDWTTTEALSPALAPFGGIQSAPDLPEEALVRVLETADDWCRANKVPRLVIRTAPVAYDEKEATVLRTVYERCGFTPTFAHINHHIRVTPTPFIDRIHPSERRRLRKCWRSGFTAEILKKPDPAHIYTFLAESRRQQGYPLSLDFEQFQTLLTNLSHQVQVIVVKDRNEIISLTVAVRVSSRILYNFCPADNLDYRSSSPMVLLNCFLYEYAQQAGIELIDLGISLDHLGNEKASLIRFKENLGAEKSEKVTYEKEFY